MVCHMMSSSRKETELLREADTRLRLPREACGMIFLRRPEGSRLFMDQENSVAGRSPTDAKALRWEGSPSVQGTAEGPFG